MKQFRSFLETFATIFIAIAVNIVLWKVAMHFVRASDRPQIEEASGSISASVATTSLGVGSLALVEFADFECPFCGTHAREVEPLIREAFVKTGILREVFFNLPLPIHAHAQSAGEAAVCAGQQGKFWEMYDALYANQTALEDHDLITRTDRLGLNHDQFAQCVRQGEARPLIDSQKSVARQMEVQATPAFFIGMVQPDGSISLKTRINGALPFEDFEAAILKIAPDHLRSQIRRSAQASLPSASQQ
jgi:protein-disulfide isomerase